MDYYNIVICKIADGPGVLGYSFLPISVPFPFDATVLDILEFGSEEFSGSTIAHEAGHWLGLPHTFNGCNQGDSVADTPATNSPSYNRYSYPFCPIAAQGAAGTDGNFVSDCPGVGPYMVQNIMDYNIEICQSYFSKGQAERMRSFLAAGTRSRLSISPGLGPACETYNCTGKQCGDDGCGGICGSCPADRACTDFKCQLVVLNERCSGAIAIPFNSLPFSSNIVTYPTPASFSCGNKIYNTLWYKIVPAQSGGLTVSTANTMFDTSLAIFNGSCGTLRCEAFNDDANFPADITSRISRCVTAGVVYFIQVSSFSANNFGNARLQVQYSPTCCQSSCVNKQCGDDGCGGFCPSFCSITQTCTNNRCTSNGTVANDACSGAVSVSPNGGLQFGSTNGASFDIVTSCPSSTVQANMGVWYTFVGNGNVMIVDNCASEFDSQIHIFTAIDCDSLACLVEGDDGCPSGFGASVQACFEAGQKYYMLVDGYNGRSGRFYFSFTSIGSCSAADQVVEYIPPPYVELISKFSQIPVSTGNNFITSRQNHDICESAMDLEPYFSFGTLTVSADTRSSTSMSFGCVQSRAPGLWYSFMGDGHMIEINPCLTTDGMVAYPYIIHVLEATEFSCDSPICANFLPKSADSCNGVVLCSEANMKYYILLEGDNQSGQAYLTVTKSQLPCNMPPNHSCEAATPLLADSPHTFTHKDVPSSFIPDCSALEAPEGFLILTNAAWFRYDAVSAGEIFVDICNGQLGQFYVQVYHYDEQPFSPFVSACENCMPFSASSVSDCHGGTRKFCAEPNNTYYIVVYGEYGHYSINLRSSPVCTLQCAPICLNGNQCGDNGCGGVCGTCGQDQTCNAENFCELSVLNEFCSGAEEISFASLPLSTSVTTYQSGFTGSPCVNDLTPVGFNALWFSISPSFQSTITISTNGTEEIDTMIFVYTTSSNCTDLNCLAFNDDSSPSFNTSSVSFCADGAHKYLFAVMGYAISDFGNVSLSVTDSPSCVQAPTPSHAPSKAPTRTIATTQQRPSQSTMPSRMPSRSYAQPSPSSLPPANVNSEIVIMLNKNETTNKQNAQSYIEDLLESQLNDGAQVVVASLDNDRAIVFICDTTSEDLQKLFTAFDDGTFEGTILEDAVIDSVKMGVDCPLDQYSSRQVSVSAASYLPVCLGALTALLLAFLL